MSDNPGTNVPVYFAPGEETFLASFDDTANGIQDRKRYSRSKAIRESMELYVEVLETMQQVGFDVGDMSPRDRRMAVRQAILDANR